MKKLIISILCSICFMVLYGCQSPGQTDQRYGQPLSSTGFLSDYSKLQPISQTSYRYVNPDKGIGNYGRFIIDKVEVIFDAKTKGEIKSWDDIEKLRSYMRKTVIDTLEPRYTAVERHPGPGVARVRIALTDIEMSAPLKLAKVSMELEVVDSQTGEQVAALIESQKKGVPLYGYDRWSGAKAIMDGWAKRFYDRLEESRGH
jgi:hypothetical protein